ncbi:DUF4232 domain-containing protein [Streptomyces sp. NPDC090306]|uniref:DUF4232 domain-containing protein n=1 Tax=Streptomyces sp. NPDC090306 TaxID=3365961 RepID=UPI00382A4A3D
MSRNSRTDRAVRTRYLLATAVSVLALTVSACNGGGGTDTSGAGTQGSGTSDSQPVASSPAPSSSPSARQTTGATGTGGAAGSGGTSTAAPAATDKGTSTGGGSDSGSGSGSGSVSGSGSGSGSDATSTTTKRVTCTDADTRATLSPVTRPINHLLLTVTNTGGTSCDAYGAPLLGFDGDQSTLRILDASKPQAVVTLAPGESAYASIGLSGDGDNGRKVSGLRLFFQGRDLRGSVGGVTNLSLPGGSAYVDSKAFVTYWQFSMADVLTY